MMLVAEGFSARGGSRQKAGSLPFFYSKEMET